MIATWGRSPAGATCCGAAWRLRSGLSPVYLRGLAEEERLRSGPFRQGKSRGGGAGRGGAERGSSRGISTRSGSEAAVLLQLPDGGGGGGEDDDDDEDCGGDGGGNGRCSRGAAAGSAAARTAAEGPAGRGAEQLRHGECGGRRRAAAGGAGAVPLPPRSSAGVGPGGPGPAYRGLRGLEKGPERSPGAQGTRSVSQSDLAREAGDSQRAASVVIDAPPTCTVTTSPSHAEGH
ncbi:spidroin-1-like [Hippopotamus amphibius kiboko]|uniref:spidroin-1-like n=1 Tax=Hippopotamus amphibius kiboko TaxID=575201 RepID=UPI002591D13C|nr:spidroin-1-like [Hippopotamus amphibius kiboko]